MLICFAIPDEARFLAAPGFGTRIVITGIGRRNAARSILNALAPECPRLVLTCGFAGGLNPSLQTGTILFQADPQAGLDQILKKLGAMEGSFHCSERIATTAAEKQLLWKTTAADAVEMESEFIRIACHERKIPSATIRAISDGADNDLPLDFNDLLTTGCKLSYPRLIWKLLTSPSCLPGLMRLQRDSRTAARSLGLLLTELLRLPPQRDLL
jgi:adenosylhomocysteine nucleosidase